MNEKEFDSSVNEYEEEYKSSNYVKQLQWDMAIGLQEVDNLKPSKYLEKLLEENVEGDLTIEEVEKELREYYVEKENKNEVNHNELECDFVSARIVELLDEDKFELSVDYLKYVHKFLFQDVYEFAGEFRKIDFSKHEKILNNDSVAYGDCNTLTKSLEYDISLEKEKNYKEMNIVEVINNITKFSSSIWQVHPFREGNGRSTRIWLDCIFKKKLGKCVDWSKVDKQDYLLAMERSPIKDLERKELLRGALTDKINDRQVYMKGIDASYAIEGYSVFSVEDL